MPNSQLRFENSPDGNQFIPSVLSEMTTARTALRMAMLAWRELLAEIAWTFPEIAR
jgi:hypothetical protein